MKQRALARNHLFEKAGHTYYQYVPPKLDQDEKEEIEKVVFLGEVGSGKTIAINSIINSIAEVKFNDKERIILQEKYDEPTKTITDNFVDLKDGKILNFVDVPGLGTSEDEKIINDLAQKLKRSIIKAFVIVVKSFTRMTPIFRSVCAAFQKLNVEDKEGKKVKVFLLHTFSDNKGISEGLFNNDCYNFERELSIKFNNESLFRAEKEKGEESDDEDTKKFIETLYDFQMKQVSKFLEKILPLPSVNHGIEKKEFQLWKWVLVITFISLLAIVIVICFFAPTTAEKLRLPYMGKEVQNFLAKDLPSTVPIQNNINEPAIINDKKFIQAQNSNSKNSRLSKSNQDSYHEVTSNKPEEATKLTKSSNQGVLKPDSTK